MQIAFKFAWAYLEEYFSNGHEFKKFNFRKICYSSVNGGLDSGGSGKYSENLINGGPHKRVGVRLGNPYLNIRHKIMLYMPIPAYT